MRRGTTGSLAALPAVAALLVAGGAGAVPPAEPRAGGNLLAGRMPSRVVGVSGARRLTDGVLAETGDHWRTRVTSTIRRRDGVVEFDLGRIVPVQCALLQGDNNDAYVLQGSADGSRWSQLWTAPPVPEAGMQLRLATDLAAQVRFARLVPRGDGSFSVGELGLWSQCPAQWPPPLATVHARPLEQTARTEMVLFAAAAILFFAIHRRGAPRIVGAGVVVPVGFALQLAGTLAELWPLEEDLLGPLRATIAAVAAFLLLREVAGAGRLQADRRWITAALAVLAVAGFACFYRLGMPQFDDASRQRRTLVHGWDMRVYFPQAKYFPELRFDGLYLASVAAYLDNTGKDAGELAKVRLRDLRDNQVRRVEEVPAELEELRARFTPSRWAEFRQDMEYFRRLMGDGAYLGSMNDHGGNATPVWLLAAHLLFRWAPASELTLSLAALIDPLLLVLLLVAVGRTYGLRAALVCAAIFGTSDFQRFGTNLMGSTLRYDWMVLIGFGACALRAGRPFLGGVLLAHAGLIRAFPAFAAAFLVVPAAWWVVDEWRERRRPPGLAALLEAQRPTLRAVAGVAAAVVALVAASSAVFSFDASWGAWARKIAIHADKPNVNHVGLRNVLSYEPEHVGSKVLRHELAEPWTDWQAHQLAALDRRRPLFWAGLVLFGLAALVACRGRGLDQAALAGMLLVPIALYPGNYYLHYVFLLPLVAVPGAGDDRNGLLFPWVSAVILGLGVAQYFTLRTGGLDVLYTKQSALLLLAFAALLAPLVARAVPGLLGARAGRSGQEPFLPGAATPAGITLAARLRDDRSGGSPR